MAANVHVSSIEALGDFRANLIVFRSAAMQALDEVTAEVQRTRQWLRHDQRLHWEGEIRRRQKKLDDAQQEYMRARLSSLQDSTAAQQNAVTKMRRLLHEAEDKLRAVKQWDRNFDTLVDPVAKQLGGLRTMLEHDTPKGIAFLANAQMALDVYSDRQTPADATAPAEIAPEDQPQNP
jgi:chromosome segregation ATPase